MRQVIRKNDDNLESLLIRFVQKPNYLERDFLMLEIETIF